MEPSVEDMQKRLEASHGLRRRSDKKAARANAANAELRETVRRKDIENRKLKLLLDADSDLLRERLRIAEERLNLISEISRTKSDTTVIKYTGDGPVKVKAQI